jgi:hypothetical protein
VFHTANQFFHNAYHSVNGDWIDFIYHTAHEELQQRRMIHSSENFYKSFFPDVLLFLSCPPRQAYFIEVSDLLCSVALGCVLEMLWIVDASHMISNC